MDLLILAIRDLGRLLAGPLLVLWFVVGWAAPFLLLSTVLSLRRIARALERIADGRGDAERAAPGAVIGV